MTKVGFEMFSLHSSAVHVNIELLNLNDKIKSYKCANIAEYNACLLDSISLIECARTSPLQDVN